MNDPNRPALIRKALILEWCLISYNILEAAAALVFGVWAKSIALVGFGLDSVIEVFSAAILVWRLSHKGSSEEEEKKEKKALFFVGITFFLLAAYVGYESIMKLWHQDKPDASLPGIVLAVLSVIIMPVLGFAKMKIASQIGSRALKADSMETIICAYLSVILLVGLVLNGLFGWWWADPVAGLVMISFLVKEGWEAMSGKGCCG